MIEFHHARVTIWPKEGYFKGADFDHSWLGYLLELEDIEQLTSRNDVSHENASKPAT